MQKNLSQEAEIERLRKENEHYRNLLTFSSAGILVLSHCGSAEDIRVLEVNSAFTKMTGYTLETIQTDHHGIYLNLVDPRDREALAKQIGAQSAGSGHFEATYRLTTRTGGFVWVKETCQIFGEAPPVRDCVLMDITALIWHQEQLAQSERLFRITSNASGGAVFDLDLATGTYLHFENAERIYGVPAEQVISETKWFGTLSPQKSLTAMIDYFYHPDDAGIVSAAFGHLLQDKEIHYIARSKRADGTFLWTQVHITLILDEKGVPIRRVGNLLNIDSIKRYADRMAQSEQLFRITNAASGGAVFDLDLAAGTYLHFENAERIYGVPAERIISETKWFGTLSPQKALDAMISYFYHPDDAYIVGEAFQQLPQKHSIEYTARSRRADGSYIWSRIHIALIFDENGVPVRRVGHILDIDEMTRQMERLKGQAQKDPLTGVYNKTATQAIVETVLKKRNDDLTALMVLDIDNFKGVNDTLGHAAGDAVLIDVCEKLKRTFSDQTIGRIGGDEFIVFAMGMRNETDVLEKANRLCELFRETYIGPNKDYHISCSVGIAISNDNENFQELFKKADAALYQAKTSGKNRPCLYEAKQIQGGPKE